MALTYVVIKQAKEQLQTAINRFNNAQSDEEIDNAIYEVNDKERKYKNLFRAIHKREPSENECEG